MQQGQQPFWAWLQLLARLTFNTRNNAANKPARLAQLDDGNDRAILVHGDEGPAQVVRLGHLGTPSLDAATKLPCPRRPPHSIFRFRVIRLRSEISLWPAFADVRRLQPQIIERRRHAAEAGDYRLSPPSHGTRNRKFESISLHRRVTCEPDLTAAAAGAGSISAQERHRQRSPPCRPGGPRF